MGSIGDPFTTSVPTVGSSGPGFATSINAILTEVIARLSVKVPLTSVNISTNLDVAGSSVLNVSGLTFQNLALAPAGAPVNRLATFNGDLYYVSPSGTIQLTVGGLLNSAAIGGITGDYGGANPAQFRFVDADQRYNAFDDFGTNTWGFVRARGFDVAASATSTLFARILFAGAASKTYTLPPAAATSGDKPLYMDSSGNITVGHGTKVYSFGAAGSVVEGGTFVFASGRQINCGSGVTSISKALDAMQPGYTFTTVTVDISKPNANSTTINVLRNVAGTITLLGTASTTTTGRSAPVVTLGAAETVPASAYYILEINVGTSPAGFLFDGARVTGTMPA